jgi:hypothetical protein
MAIRRFKRSTETYDCATFPDSAQLPKHPFQISLSVKRIEYFNELLGEFQSNSKSISVKFKMNFSQILKVFQ